MEESRMEITYPGCCCLAGIGREWKKQRSRQTTMSCSGLFSRKKEGGGGGGGEGGEEESGSWEGNCFNNKKADFAR